MTLMARRTHANGRASLADTLLAIEKRELHCIDTPKQLPLAK